MQKYGKIRAEGSQIRRLDEKEYLHLQVFANGAASIYEKWIRGKYRLSSREAAKAINQLMPHSIQRRLFQNV